MSNVFSKEIGGLSADNTEMPSFASRDVSAKNEILQDGNEEFSALSNKLPDFSESENEGIMPHKGAEVSFGGISESLVFDAKYYSGKLGDKINLEYDQDKANALQKVKDRLDTALNDHISSGGYDINSLHNAIWDAKAVL